MTTKIKISALKRFLWFYISTIIVLLIIIFFLILFKNGYVIDTTVLFFKDSVDTILTSTSFYVVAMIPYLIFLLIKSIFYDYRQNKIKGIFKGVFFKIVSPITVLIIGNYLLQNYRLSEVLSYNWDNTVENNSTKVKDYYSIDKKQRGIHVFNIGENLEDIELLKTNNFEWITLTPFINQDIYNKPTLSLISDYSYNSRLKYYKTIKEECDKFGIKIMLKPHIWLSNMDNGKWRSDIKMNTEYDWNIWFKNYSQVIVKYAQLAQELGLEQFCIGTELETTVYEKPKLWNALIKKIKSIYSGKLTYAANWNREFEQVPFWNELDYIGVQAYFPISKINNPTLLELQSN